MTISDQEYAAANKRAASKKSAFPAAVSVRYDKRADRIVIELTSGLELGFSPKQAQGFEHADPTDLEAAEITPSGLGIYFPRLDQDIYIPGLLDGFLGSKRWMPAQHGSIGGAVSTPAKAAAARENGKKGGRPRKNKTLTEV